jgi:hemerythrin superfamily protein
MQPVDMNPVRMRIIEELDNGDEVITYFDILEVESKYYYVYNEVNHGPYHAFEEAVDAAYEDLIPGDTESL